MELNYYVLVTSLRKQTDRNHFHKKTNPNKSGKDYFDKSELIDKLDYNDISYAQLYEEDFGIIRDNLLLVKCQPCLEERLYELVDKSIFLILMRTNQPDYIGNRD